MTITPSLLVAAMGCSMERADLFAPYLDEACAAYGINNQARLAAFLAQIGHESGSLRHVTEVWGPTPAQERYEGRTDLGNVQAGDGRRYAGRGLIQTTGRYNYRAVRDRLRARGMDCPDFEAAPDLLAEPRWAAWSAADYWGWKDCNALADVGSFEAITVRINGGTNGLADRLARWERAKTALGITGKPAAAAPPKPAGDPAQYSQEAGMPIPAVAMALLPSLIEALPKLGALFGSGSKVSERNAAGIGLALDIVQKATGTVNAQAAVEKIQNDSAAKAAAEKAVDDNWYALTESGGGGIAGARKADATFIASGEPVWKSPSFIVAICLLPLAYMIVGSVVGLFGAPFSEDVRAAIANGVIGLVIGALSGYYFGQTTSRNRTPAP